MRLIGVCLLLLLLLGCTTIKPDAARALKMHDQAEALYQAGNYADALPLFKRLAGDFPRDSELQLRVGNCYAREGHFEQAVAAYELAVLRDPGASRAWYNLSYVRAQMLAATVVRMHEHIEPADPGATQMRKLVADVLAPFGLAGEIEQLDKKVSPIVRPVTSEDSLGAESDAVAAEPEAIDVTEEALP